MKSTRSLVFIICFVLIACLVLPIYGAYTYGLQWIFNSFREDAFYYFTVAKNSTTGFYTYDGISPINGFHPLWQYLLTAVFEIVGKSNDIAQVYSAWGLSVATVSLGYLMFCLALFRITRSALLAVLVFPGLYGLFASMCSHSVCDSYWILPPWNSMNGMESGLSILAGGMLLFLISSIIADRDNPDGRALSNIFLIKLGLLVAFVIMSRLDDIFLLPSLCLCMLALAKANLKTKLVKSLVLASPSVVILGLYLTFNLVSVGVLIPVSGALKSGFALSTNLRFVIAGFFPFSQGVGALVGRSSDFLLFQRGAITNIQIFQIVGPIVIATALIAGLASFRKNERIGRDAFWLYTALMIYVIFKGLYCFLFVSCYFQGAWYFHLSFAFINAVGVVTLATLLEARPWKANNMRLALVALALGLLMGAVGTKYVVHQASSYNRAYEFWKNRLAIRNELLKIEPNPKILEYSDGVIGYCLNLPTMNAMYNMDREAYEASKKGSLLAHAVSKGVNLVGDSGYFGLPNVKTSPDKRFEFNVALEHKASRTCFATVARTKRDNQLKK